MFSRVEGQYTTIDSLSFLFLFTHIGLNSKFKKCSNNKANHKNLDLSLSFLFFLNLD